MQEFSKKDDVAKDSPKVWADDVIAALAEIHKRSSPKPEAESPSPVVILGDVKDEVRNELIDINLEISKIHSLGWLGRSALFWSESQLDRNSLELSAALANVFEIILPMADSVIDRIDRLETSIHCQ